MSDIDPSTEFAGALRFAPFLIERGAKLNPNAAAKLGMLDALRTLVAAIRRARPT